MAAKKKHKATGKNILSNMLKRVERAKRQWKSENYIKDLQTALAKRR